MSTQQQTTATAQTTAGGTPPVLRFRRAPYGWSVVVDGVSLGTLERGADGTTWDATAATGGTIGYGYRTRMDAAAALMAAAAEDTATVDAGGVRLRVVRSHVDAERRTVYAWSVTEFPSLRTLGTGRDISTGVGMDRGPAAALASLCRFIAAAEESFRYRGPDGEPGENADMFAPAILERVDADALALAAEDLHAEH